MENPNLARSLNRTFYRLAQRSGVPGTISRRSEMTTDFATGKTTQTVTTAAIRKLVRVAVAGDSREVLYTASMMQSLRPFAWQGGAGQTVKHAVFLIHKNDLRDWGEITPSQWIRWDKRNWQVVSSLRNEGGWIIEAKLAEGQESGIVVTVEDELSLAEVTGEVVE